MKTNEDTIRELYACAEGGQSDPERFNSFFSADGYLFDVASGQKYRGKEIGAALVPFESAFPDVHRELFSIYSTGDAVVVELAIRGTHKDALSFPGGSLPATGNAIDVPCCDVFQLKGGKVVSFHCYTMASIMQQQLSSETS